ncbi:hypothetical protein ACF2JD_04645 [Aeromonas sp. A-5]|uniref:hypothetical protein n=1 Tax=Aeromonas ichthyocola TaxID=3367746 RepID=UPI0038E8892A
MQAKVGVSWYQMGWQIGHWLAQRHPAGSKPVSVALFPGPQASGGNNFVEPGFADAIKGSAIKLVTTSAATTAGKSSALWCSSTSGPLSRTSTIWWGGPSPPKWRSTSWRSAISTGPKC